MSKKLGATKGTAVWAFDRFRSDALSKILNDLLVLERTGIDEDICKKVQAALGQVINEATSIPDGSFLGKPLWKDLEAFKDTYIKWNDVRGDDDECVEKRKEILKKLRDKRHKVARRARRNQFVLSNELDLEVVNNMYKAMSDLASAVPSIFVQLSTAVTNYEEGIDKSA